MWRSKQSLENLYIEYYMTLMISKILPPLSPKYLLIKYANVLLSKVRVILVAWLSSRDVTMACSLAYFVSSSCIICKVCKSACHRYLGIWKTVRLYFLFLAISNKAYLVLVFVSCFLKSISFAMFLSHIHCFLSLFLPRAVSTDLTTNIHQIHHVKGSVCQALNHLQSQME